MPRSRGVPKSRARRKKILKQAKGYWGSRSRLIKVARVRVIRAGMRSYQGRKLRKRDFRRLWIIRINSAVRERGMNYRDFIFGLKKAGIEIDRKALAELAVREPDGFSKIVEEARQSLQANP